MIAIGNIKIKNIPGIQSVYFQDIKIFPDGEEDGGTDITKNFRNTLEGMGVTVTDEFEFLYDNLTEDQKNSDIILLPVAVSEGVVYAMDAKTGMPIEFAFSRATYATHFDRNHNLLTVPTNVPRIDYANYSLNSKILIEKTATNAIISEQGGYGADLIDANLKCFNSDFNNWKKLYSDTATAIGNLSFIIENPNKLLSTGSFAIRKGTLEKTNSGFNNSDRGGTTYINSKREYGNAIVEQRPNTNMMSISLTDNSDNIVSITSTDFTAYPRLWVYLGQWNVSEIGNTFIGIAQVEFGDKKTSYINNPFGVATRSGDLLKTNISQSSSLSIKTSDLNLIEVDVESGEINIHELLPESTGIELLTIKYKK